VPVTARVTIHRYNIHDLDNVAKLLLEELGLCGFSTNSASYIGSCRTDADNILPKTTDRQDAMEILLNLSKKYKGKISALAGPLAEARIWRNMEDARLKGLPSFSIGGRLTGCGCTFTELTILSDGSIVPCNMLAHLKLGHINEDVFQDIWLRSLALNNMRLRHNIQLTAQVIVQE
jgi:SynChlorMet cassette radical SAM/SPASM protein ScmE